MTIINVLTTGITISEPTSCVLLRLIQFFSFFGALKKRDREGMSAANVAQKPIFAITTTINAVNVAIPVVGDSTHDHTSFPEEVALSASATYIQQEMKIMIGAAKSAKRSIDLIPKEVFNNWNTAKNTKQTNQLSKSNKIFKIPLIAKEPKYVLIPNQHDAVIPLTNEGRCVPNVPNGARI